MSDKNNGSLNPNKASEEMIDIILTGKYRFKVDYVFIKQRKNDEIEKQKPSKRREKPNGRLEKKREEGELLPRISNEVSARFKRAKLESGFSLCSGGKNIEGRQTNMNFMKIADFLIPKEDLNEEDLEIIVAEINKQEGGFKDINTSKLYSTINLTKGSFKNILKQNRDSDHFNLINKRELLNLKNERTIVRILTS